MNYIRSTMHNVAYTNNLNIDIAFNDIEYIKIKY